MNLAAIDATSEQYLGQWKHLVSTTNWEKGRIISGWRGSLIEADAPSSDYSDEAWSQYVGNVTPQHVGRLRRVFERFGEARETYPGLFWSHFQAGLDWTDAEMWLEGAVQNGWSISEMRRTRWEALGGGEEQPALESEVAAPWDEDADVSASEVTTGAVAEIKSPGRTRDVEPESDEDAAFDHAQFAEAATDWEGGEPTLADPRAQVRPFANLPSLPADVSDAFESLKLAILRHRLAGWQEVSSDDVLLALDSLKQLALAPADA